MEKEIHGNSKPMMAAAYFSKIGNNMYTFLAKYVKIYLLFIILFAHTGLSKLLDLNTFEFAIWRAQLLRPYYYPLALFIPISEIVIAILLAFPVIRVGRWVIPARKYGLYGSLILMVLFTIYLAYSLLFYSGSLPCTCGGIVSAMTWKQHLIFNIFFSFLACRAIYLNNRSDRKIIQIKK